MIKSTLREGTFVQKIRTDNYWALILKEHHLSLDRVILEHEQNVTNMTNVLKYQKKTQLSKVDRFCVKSYTRPKLFNSPYALRAWKGLMLLLFNGIPVADPVALVVKKDQKSILITEMVEEKDLNRVLYHEYPMMHIKDKLEIARELGKLLGILHKNNIYHADLKSSNIKLLRDPARFILLDTDKVLQVRYLARRKRLKNLMNINTSIPRHVSRGVRMAFVHAYTGITGEDPKAIFLKVWESSMKETIAYRTDTGDRSESW